MRATLRMPGPEHSRPLDQGEVQPSGRAVRGSQPSLRPKIDVIFKDFSLASLRYDLSKLRAQGLISKLPRSRRVGT